MEKQKNGVSKDKSETTFFKGTGHDHCYRQVYLSPEKTICPQTIIPPTGVLSFCRVNVCMQILQVSQKQPKMAIDRIRWKLELKAGTRRCSSKYNMCWCLQRINQRHHTYRTNPKTNLNCNHREWQCNTCRVRSAKYMCALARVTNRVHNIHCYFHFYFTCGWMCKTLLWRKARIVRTYKHRNVGLRKPSIPVKSSQVVST